MFLFLTPLVINRIIYKLFKLCIIMKKEKIRVETDEVVVKKKLPRIIKNITALDNKNRREILRLCINEAKTISELKRILKSSNKVTWNNVKKLSDAGFVKLEKKENEKPPPVYVRSLVLPISIVESFEKTMIDAYHTMENENQN